MTARRRARLRDQGKAAGGAAALAMHRTFGNRARGRIGILIYHRVTSFDRSDAPPDAVTPGCFRAQIEGLLDRGVHFAGLSDVIVAGAAGEALPPKTAVVTFDDGYQNVFDSAFPVLADLGVPATVFLATAYIGTSERFPFDPWSRHREETLPATAWRPLDWSACVELQASGLFEVGTHTHTHGDFRTRTDEFQVDVRRSLDLLGEHLGAGPRTFAFPYGTVRAGFAGPALVEAARKTGVTCALTTEIELIDPASDPFGWGRLEAVESDSAGVCEAKLAGWYNWMGTSRNFFQRTVAR